MGSRNPTPQGQANAQAFAQAFAQDQWVVISGLALGIDASAHLGALEGGGYTVAVVGTGLDRVYPRKNQALAHQVAQHGMILSEYPLGTPAMAENFPQRNRLIAGLALGVLVVEAAEKSGSLITARLGSEQGKEVFAIPGSIHAPQSKGCHALLKQGAKLVENAQDILDELRLSKPLQTTLPRAPKNSLLSNSQKEQNQPLQTSSLPKNEKTTQFHEPAHLPPDQLQILQALGHDLCTLDTLIDRTGWDAASLQIHLLDLELAGRVARLPGGLFQQLARA